MARAPSHRAGPPGVQRRYVEKPGSHTVFESKQIVAAARKYDRIVQHGVNARSHGGPREAIQKMREGLIGDVYMARCATIGATRLAASPWSRYRLE